MASALHTTSNSETAHDRQHVEVYLRYMILSSNQEDGTILWEFPKSGPQYGPKTLGSFRIPKKEPQFMKLPCWYFPEDPNSPT